VNHQDQITWLASFNSCVTGDARRRRCCGRLKQRMLVTVDPDQHVDRHAEVTCRLEVIGDCLHLPGRRRVTAGVGHDIVAHPCPFADTVPRPSQLLHGPPLIVHDMGNPSAASSFCQRRTCATKRRCTVPVAAAFYCPLRRCQAGRALPARDQTTSILSLSKMNWNNSDGISRYPITLTFAKRVGQLMSELSENQIPTPSYRFHM
jgi:hypothetical protein